MMGYRPEIDGLRGFAVSAVLFFHAGLPLITGGYVGVDIFFVISGYLITSIILSDLKSGKFSFKQFYERRIRRILPAFYVVALLSLLVGWFVLPALEYKKMSMAGLAAMFFSSNVFFWRTTNYFSSASEYEPFLHTWSLGVEEQFYFFFPLLLILFAHHRRLLLPITTCVLLLSFAICVYASYHHAWAGYYLLPSRAWQLMVGAALAIYPLAVSESKPTKHILAILALCCLILPLFLYSKGTRFPGVAAVAPTLGAALVIYLGGDKQLWLTKLFSTKLLVGIGLISYSLYLWHWPIFAYVRNYNADVDLPIGISFLGILLSLLLAWLSWKYVEALFRNKQLVTSKTVFWSAGLSSLFLVGILVSIFVQQGVPQRMDPLAIYYSELKGDHILSDPCVHQKAADINSGLACSSGENADIIFWGDSHAGALKRTLQRQVPKWGREAFFVGRVGCPPVPDILKANSDSGSVCLKYNQAVENFITTNKNLKYVVLHARWALSVEGSRYKTEPGVGYVIRDTQNPDQDDNRVNMEAAMLRFITRMVDAGKQVIIVGPVPEIGFHVPRNLANEIIWGRKRELRPTLDEYIERQENTLVILDRAVELGAKVVLPHKLFCESGRCEVKEGDKSLYFDDDHLTDLGAERVVNAVGKAIRSLGD